MDLTAEFAFFFCQFVHFDLKKNYFNIENISGRKYNLPLCFDFECAKFVVSV